MAERRGLLARAFGRGHFPHQFSWLIDNPIRRLLVTPDQLADRLAVAASDQVLEIGPGSGYFSVELARRLRHGRLELLDLQQQMLAKAKRKLDRKGILNVGYTVGDAGLGLPFQDQSFDLALMVAVLGEIPDAKSCLRQLSRVLRLGGVLAVHEHVPDPDRIRFSVLRPLVESEGFGFGRRWGPQWNYTAVFNRLR